ncbi:MAG: phosphatidate cytidylyltransferase [candidate division Zixibacteria bacterium]
MSSITPAVATILIIFGGLTIINGIRLALRISFPCDSCLSVAWLFFAIFATAELIGFPLAIWLLGLICFVALREYLSLIDVRLQDRLAILGAYLSIPFMIYCIQVDWYGMFIISIPVYSFLAIPLLISLGGSQTKGTVYSIGAIDFGLFAFVFCIGHIGYLMLFNIWMAALLILNVMICDSVWSLTDRLSKSKPSIIAMALTPLPLTGLLNWLLIEYSEIPLVHALILAALIPLLVIMGHHTGEFIKADLAMDSERLPPGRGDMLDNMKSLLFAGPVVFHYIYYFLR